MTESKAPRWFDLTKELIDSRYKPGEIFTASEIHQHFENKLQATYPKNNTIRETLARTLQELRNSGYLEFIDNRGTYRVTTTDTKANQPIRVAAQQSDTQGTPTHSIRKVIMPTNESIAISDFSIVDAATFELSGERSPIEIHLQVTGLELSQPSYENSIDEYTYQIFGPIMRVTANRAGRPTNDIEINSSTLFDEPIFRVYITQNVPRSYEFYMRARKIQGLLRKGSSSVAPHSYEIVPIPALAYQKKNAWSIQRTTRMCIRCEREGQRFDTLTSTERITVVRQRSIDLCSSHASAFRSEAAQRRLDQ